MKTRRIASALALAAALTLGATGCGLTAPQGTTDPYAPSDGIDVNVAGVDVRNLMLIADETGESFNAVFTTVNLSETEIPMRMTVVTADGASEASIDVMVAPGTTLFGEPDGATAPVLLPLPNVMVGSMLTAFFQVPGATDIERQVPVLDGTLPEYRPYVLSATEVVPVAPGEAVELEDVVVEEEIEIAE